VAHHKYLLLAVRVVCNCDVIILRPASAQAEPGGPSAVRSGLVTVIKHAVGADDEEVQRPIRPIAHRQLGGRADMRTEGVEGGPIGSGAAARDLLPDMIDRAVRADYENFQTPIRIDADRGNRIRIPGVAGAHGNPARPGTSRGSLVILIQCSGGADAYGKHRQAAIGSAGRAGIDVVDQCGSGALRSANASRCDDTDG